MSLIKSLKENQYIVLAEMSTPKGVDLADFVSCARNLKGRVQAVLIPDMSHAVMRLSATAGAVVLGEQGLDVVVQFCCRDRNRLALQADLLGAHVLGLSAVMAVDGEDVELGDHLQAQPVNDLNAVSFLSVASGLAAGKDMAGKTLQGKPEFCLGARIEPWRDSAQAKVRIGEARAAVEAGADFLIAPPVFDLKDFAVFLNEASDLGAPVLGTVILLKSVGMARYLNQNLPGVDISEDTIRRIRGSAAREAECIKIAAETAAGLKEICGGTLLTASGWENRLPAILDEAGL